MKRQALLILCAVGLMGSVELCLAQQKSPELEQCIRDLHRLAEKKVEPSAPFSIEQARRTPPILVELGKITDESLQDIRAHGRVLSENLFYVYPTVAELIQFIKNLEGKNLDQIQRDIALELEESDNPEIANVTTQLLVALDLLHEIDHGLAKKISLSFIENAPTDQADRPSSLVFHFIRSLAFREPAYFAAVMSLAEPSDFDWESTSFDEVLFWLDLLKNAEQRKLVSNEKLIAYAQHLTQKTIHRARNEDEESVKALAESLGVDPFDFFFNEPARLTQQKIKIWAQASRIHFAMKLLNGIRQELKARGAESKILVSLKTMEQNLLQIRQAYQREFEALPNVSKRSD